MITVRYKPGKGCFARTYKNPLDSKTLFGTSAEAWDLSEAKAFVNQHPDTFELIYKRGCVDKVIG